MTWHGPHRGPIRALYFYSLFWLTGMLLVKWGTPLKERIRLCKDVCREIKDISDKDLHAAFHQAPVSAPRPDYSDPAYRDWQNTTFIGPWSIRMWKFKYKHQHLIWALWRSGDPTPRLTAARMLLKGMEEEAARRGTHGTQT